MTRSVAVTGTGAVTPLGIGSRTLFERWVRGDSGIESGLGHCTDFEGREHLSKKERRRTDRFTQFAIAASEEAMEQAGWDDQPYPAERVGCVIGSGIGGIETIEAQHEITLRAGRPPSALAVPMMMSNAAAAHIALRHGFEGPSYGIISACATGAHAIGAGMRMIQTGEADAVLVGGSEAAMTEMTKRSFLAMGAMSPTGKCRPFDARRDGFVLSEGAGVLILEAAGTARRRGATPIAHLYGYAATTDAHHITAPKPGGGGAARAIERALADANLRPADIDYVNAHGTSTLLNDRVETDAIKAALGDHAYNVPVSSTKSAIGHTLGAAGAVEAIALIYSLREQTAPPTLGYEQLDPGLDLDYVPRAKRLPSRAGRPERIGISNSFGFGGHNAVVCVGAEPPV